MKEIINQVCLNFYNKIHITYHNELNQTYTIEIDIFNRNSNINKTYYGIAPEPAIPLNSAILMSIN